MISLVEIICKRHLTEALRSSKYESNLLEEDQNVSKKWVVEYRDEEGRDTAEFNTHADAVKWVRVHEAMCSSGEKFWFEDIYEI